MNKNNDEFPTPVGVYYLKDIKHIDKNPCCEIKITKEDLDDEFKIGWYYVEALQRKALQDIQDEIGREIIKAVKNVIGVEKKCECGGEKCGTTHSDWCPMYEEDNV